MTGRFAHRPLFDIGAAVMNGFLDDASRHGVEVGTKSGIDLLEFRPKPRPQ
jgi:hypothetical protein